MDLYVILSIKIIIDIQCLDPLSVFELELKKREGFRFKQLHVKNDCV